MHSLHNTIGRRSRRYLNYREIFLERSMLYVHKDVFTLGADEKSEMNRKAKKLAIVVIVSVRLRLHVEGRKLVQKHVRMERGWRQGFT